jgi:hypothetical protein
MYDPPAYLWAIIIAGPTAVAGLTCGALTGFGLLNVSPSSAPITELPLALIPTATVPLLFTLHITSMFTLARAPRPAPSATGPLFPAPRRALLWREARRPMLGEVLNAEEKTGSALSTRSRRRPPGRAPAGVTPSCSPGSSWPPSFTRRAIRPHDCTPGMGPVNGKETQ